MVDPNEHDVFLLRQKLTAMVNRYDFTLPDDGDGGAPGERVAFVEQARFKFKEDIRFYTDESKSVEILRIKARQRFDPRARYDVTDAQDRKIGEIQKDFGRSLLRSTYVLYGPDGAEVCRATEASGSIAILRRIAAQLPYIGDFVPIPYNFVFVRDGDVLATNVRQAWKLRDTYTIDARADTGHTLDRRLLLAAAVGMDALQAR
jgi:uncharacterized protein YxjI